MNNQIRADHIKLIVDWLVAGATGGELRCSAMSEMVAILGDPPIPPAEEQWPPAVAEMIAADEANPVPLGGWRYIRLAAYEACGVKPHPELKRLIGRLLFHPPHRDRYLSALAALKQALGQVVQ